MEWYPIDTAPEQEPILVASDTGDVMIARLNGFYDSGTPHWKHQDYWHWEDMLEKPEKWMPLPEA